MNSPSNAFSHRRREQQHMSNDEPLKLTTQDEFNQRTGANVAAIGQLLIRKGIFTAEELEAETNRMIHEIDQARAKFMEEFLKTPEGQAADLFRKLIGQ
jgi:uncharacterized protein YceH (UPF0502 family)